MDQPPETDLEGHMSDPEETEDDRLATRLQGESDFDSEEEDLVAGEADIMHQESIIARMKRRQQEEQQQAMMSKTPSPTSPEQYLYATGHPYYLNQSQMAAAVAMAAAVNHPHLAGASSTGSATPPNNGLVPSPRQHPSNEPSDQSKYTFEEQFKQLYELSDDPRRKEFLDDLFSYMQKRGTPVNRIPIMAKHVLDLYQLYMLVVARGGLVEVINKKIWREITKGLNLPSSITSAAFTLRTQYMKYLYAYECVKEKLSTNDELQAAIDGNRREGRRSSYGPYQDNIISPGHHRNNIPPQLPAPLSVLHRAPHMNGHHLGSSGRSQQGSPQQHPFYSHNSLPLNLAAVPPPTTHVKQENGSIYSNHLSSPSGEEENCNSIPSTPNPMQMPLQQEALNLEVSRNSSSLHHHLNNNNSSNNNNSNLLNNNLDQKPLNMASSKKHHHHSVEEGVREAKRQMMEVDDTRLHRSSMPSTHIKISNRGPDGRTQSDGSLMVSMEVNGIMYTGVLYAATQNHRNRL